MFFTAVLQQRIKIFIMAPISKYHFMKIQSHNLTLHPKLFQAKPYDPKKSCWVPDKASGGFSEGKIESTEGEKITVQIKGGDKKVFKKDRKGMGKIWHLRRSEDRKGMSKIWHGRFP